MGLRPSFFLFLLMAAAAAAAALVVVAVGVVLGVSLPPFADPPAAPVIDGAYACCAWGPLCFRAGRAMFVIAPVGIAPAPTPALSLLACCPPFMMAIRYLVVFCK